jgi:hypothetical protein
MNFLGIFLYKKRHVWLGIKIKSEIKGGKHKGMFCQTHP